VAAKTTSDNSTRQGWLLALMRLREAGIVFFILVLVAAVSIRSPYFFSIDNFRDILLNISILSIVALAQAMVIITGGIDLSVSSTIGLVAMMVAFVVARLAGFPPWLALPLGMLLGCVLGSVNGLLIAGGGLPPIIATLGTFSIYRGLVFFYSGGTWINAFELPAAFKEIAKGTPLGVPNLILIAVLVVLLVFYFLNYTRLGRDIYAVGSNKLAAQMAGVRVTRTIFMVYLISGMLSGLAGVLWASRYESAQTNTALGFELQTVAASVVGGVSVLGGSGSVPGVILGAFLLGIITNALTLVRISPFWQLAAQGLLILLAVIVDFVISRQLQRMVAVRRRA
jgi:rhamnose transport system permease protein